LAGKYLKARQLAKEIEKKAKKTAEKKKKAKEGLERAEELLEISEELGVDVSEVEEIIEEVREYFKDKEFDKASEKINEALNVCEDANKSRVDELIERTKSLCGYLDEDLEETESKELIDEVEELLEDHKYREAINIADQALDYIKRDVSEVFRERYYSIESKLDMLETLKGSPEKFEDKLRTVEEHLDDTEFERSKDLLDEVENELNQEIRAKINDKVQEIEKIEDMIRKNGISTEGVEETISKIRANSKSGDFSSVMDHFGKTERELRDKKDELVSEMVKKLRDGIEEARELGAPENKIKEINEKIDELREKEDFGNIIRLIDELFEKLEEAKFHRVLKTIAESRENFIKAKKIGIDISEPMTILNKARTALKKGDHKQALEWAKKGREKVREMVKEHERTRNAIEKAEELIDGLTEFGIDLEEFENEIKTAEDHLKNKECSEAKEIVSKLEDRIDDKAYERIMEIVEAFEVNILTLERMGIESDEYTEMLEEAIANTKTMDYIKAANTALKGKNEVEDKIKNELDDRINDITGIITNIKKTMDADDIKEDLSKVERFVKEAKDEKDKSNHKLAFDKISKAEDTVNEWQVGEADQKYKEADDMLTLLDEIDIDDIDIDEYKGKLEEAEKHIEENEYPQGIKVTEEILTNLNKKLKERSEEFFSNAKVEVVKAKKSGADITKMREELIDCKKFIKKENFANAISLSLEVEKRAVRIRKERKDAQKQISKASKTIKSIRNDVSSEKIKPIISLLKESKSSFQNRNYTEAKELANKTIDNIGEMKKKKEFEEYYGIYKELVNRAEGISVDTEYIQDEVNKAISKSDERDYSSAIELIKQNNEKILEKIKESVKPRLSHTKEIIDSAKEIGIDISAQEELLEKAQNDFENEDFKGAVKKIVECQNQIQEIRDKSKKAARTVKKAKDRMEDAMDLHADITTAKKELHTSMDAIKNDEYDRAIEMAEKALSSISLAEKNRVETILSTFKDKINDMRMEGVNTSLADNLIARAEKANKNENYKEAINLAMQSEGELERIELQQDIAKRSISTTREKLNKAKNEGIKVRKPEAILNEAKKSYDGGFYVKAFDKAVKSGDILSNKIKAFKESKEILDEINKVVKKLGEFGVQHEGLKEKYIKASDAFKNDNYEKSYSLSNRAKEEMSNLKKELPDHIEEIEKKVKELRSKGKDIGDADKFISKARANLKMGNILDVVNSLALAKEEYGGKHLEAYEDYIRETTELIEKASKFGTDVGEAQEIVKKAREMRNEDIKKASEKAKEALDKIEEILAPYSPSIELKIDGKLRLKRWNNINITVKNDGGGVAKSPSLDIDGAETEEYELPSMLKANETYETELKIKPKEETVIFKGVGTRIFDNKDINCKMEVEVTEGDFKIIDATGEEKCRVCKGDIKKGLDVIICDCGTTYHKLCGERKGRCPDCGLEFTLEEDQEEKKEKKASKRVALRI